MKPKLIVKIAIDFIMMILLLALMAYELIGAAAHEWIGAIMFALVIAHNALNWKWWRNLIKGKYTITRIAQTVINLAIFICLIVQMASGIMMARHAFTFLSVNTGMSYARTLHLVGAYWSFVLMSVHLGFHGSMLMGIAKKVTGIKKSSRIRVVILRITALAASAYGVYAFVQRELGTYMLLKNQFVFFDFDEPLILFFIDYLAILALFACVGHYALKSIGLIKRNTNPIEKNTQ